MNKNYNAVVGRYVNSCTTDVYVKLLIEPVTLPLTWLILTYTKLNANTLTAGGLLSSIIGCSIALYTLNPTWIAVGFLGFYICDFIDGPVAVGRGGGTYFGAVFDFFVDRMAILLALVSLSWLQFLNADHILVYFNFIYYAAYTQIDMNAFATLNAKYKYGLLNKVESIKSGALEDRHRAWVQGFFIPFNWVPRRLSSPLLGIVAYFLTSNYTVAYALAFIALACEYLLIAPSLIKRLTKLK
jgi:phosphatidylglycerophosphate synthase